MAGCLRYCCAYNCDEAIRPQDNVSLYAFPKDPILLRQWCLAIRRKDFEPSVNTKICSKHFEEHCFVTNAQGKRFLKKGSIPTVFSYPVAPSLKKYNIKPVSTTPMVIKLHSDGEITLEQNDDVMDEHDGSDYYINDSVISSESPSSPEPEPTSPITSVLELPSENDLNLLNVVIASAEPPSPPEPEPTSLTVSVLESPCENDTNLTVYVNKIYCSHTSPMDGDDSPNSTPHRNSKTNGKIYSHNSMPIDSRKELDMLISDKRFLQQAPFLTGLDLADLKCDLHVNSYYCHNSSEYDCNSVNGISTGSSQTSPITNYLSYLSKLPELDDKQSSLNAFTLKDMDDATRAKHFYLLAKEKLLQQQLIINELRNSS